MTSLFETRCIQRLLKMSVFYSCPRYDGKAFHAREPAAEKLLSCVRGTTQILSDTDRS